MYRSIPSTLLRLFFTGLKTNTYGTMDRMAGSWSPDGRLPRSAPSSKEGNSLSLSFPAARRKRLSWMRQSCGQGF